MKKIYIVQGNTGEYSDHTEWLVCAFDNEQMARNLATDLAALGRAAFAEREKDYEWEDKPEGKALLALDPGARIDYTGIDYTVIETELRT